MSVKRKVIVPMGSPGTDAPPLPKWAAYLTGDVRRKAPPLLGEKHFEGP